MHGRIASQFQDCNAAFHPAENVNLPFSVGKANYTKREMCPDLWFPGGTPWYKP